MAKRVKTSPRKKPRQARSKATVDAILDATAQVLVKDGYEAASTNRVAERAGVSVGSVYQYFPNKESLVGELVDRYSRAITDMVLGSLVELGDAPPERVAPAMVAAMIEFKRRDPKLARVLREQIPRVGRMQRYEKQLEEIVKATELYLARHRDRVKHDDLSTAAFIAVHAVDAATQAGVTARASIDDAALTSHVTDLVLSYLLHPGAPPLSRRAGRPQTEER